MFAILFGNLLDSSLKLWPREVTIRILSTVLYIYVLIPDYYCTINSNCFRAKSSC